MTAKARLYCSFAEMIFRGNVFNYLQKFNWNSLSAAQQFHQLQRFEQGSQNDVECSLLILFLLFLDVFIQQWLADENADETSTPRSRARLAKVHQTFWYLSETCQALAANLLTSEMLPKSGLHLHRQRQQQQQQQQRRQQWRRTADG